MKALEALSSENLLRDCSSFLGQRLGVPFGKARHRVPHTPTSRTRHPVGGVPLAVKVDQASKLAMHRNQTSIIFTPDQLLRAVKGWCWDCGERVPDYIVQKEVWNAAWPGDDRMGTKRLKRLKQAATRVFPERARSIDSNLVHVHVHLCFPCLEKRLGRKLVITDFTTKTRAGKIVKENAGIFLGFMLGQKVERAKKGEETGDKKDEGG